jgi:hypothetical protein
LRVTRTGAHDRTVFAGSLTSVSGKFVNVPTPAAGSADIVIPGKHTVYFRFVGNATSDGLDFATDCMKAFTVDVHVAGSEAPANDVFLGGGLTNPKGVPFRVERSHGLGQGLVVPTSTSSKTTVTATTAVNTLTAAKTPTAVAQTTATSA